MQGTQVARLTKALIDVLNQDELIKVAYTSRSLKVLRERLLEELQAIPADRRVDRISKRAPAIFNALIDHARAQNSTFSFKGTEYVLIQESVASTFDCPPDIIPI